MGLISDIQTIITTAYPDATLMLSSKFQANIQTYIAEPENLPIIIIDNEFPKTSEIKKNNNVIKDTKVLISFLDIDDTGNTDIQTNTIIENMEAMADAIAVRIYLLIPVRPAGNQKYKITPMFHVFSSNMSGVALEMQVNYNSIIYFGRQVMPSLDTELFHFDTELITFDLK